MADMGVLVRAAGGPEALEWTDLDTPPPGPGEVRIVQRAVGVNFIDTYYRSGLYPWPTTPLIPGAEASGMVEDVGPGVSGLKAGDRVAYTMPLGAYRTRRVLPADRLVALPESISFETAASVMLKGLTAQFLLRSCFAVREGHTVLVHAAAGGVGLLLGQWLKLLGATAIGTVGSVDKVATARANGYAYVIDNNSEDFTARVLEITAGERCDVVYDSVGNDTWRGSLKCLKLRGTFVSFGQSSGPIADFKILDLAAAGSLCASRPMLFDYIKTPQELKLRADDLFARLAAGEIKANVGKTLPLCAAAAAHRALASRLTMGSTVLLP
jgi:NADPH2:quinone reductase